MGHVPRGVGVVFKLASDADLPAVEAQFAVTRRTAIVSFTSRTAVTRPAGVHATTEPSDAAFALFATQGHERAWLAPMLRHAKAFACVLERAGEPLAACFAFENYRAVWEVGGVVTAPAHRRQGFGAQVVSTMLAELNDRRLLPRYQAEEHNTASIALARSVGLTPFLTITHYAHAC